MKKDLKHMMLPLASILASPNYTEESKRALELFDSNETIYKSHGYMNANTVKTKKQLKSRAKSKKSRQSRKRNRK
jgi:hypothetical protein